ncbi:MAG: hypothetical protein ACE5G0_07860 [Rhodothermales bacterium]
MGQNTDNEDIQARAQAILEGRKKTDALFEQLLMEQNLPPAILGGGVACLIGAGIWAAITAWLGAQFGLMAVGIGLLVGISIRFLGKGMEPVFGYVGAAWSLLGCLLGNFFSICAMIAMQEEESFASVVRSLDFETVMDIMVVWFTPVDLLFYGLALYAGYKLSFRRIRDRDMML